MGNCRGDGIGRRTRLKIVRGKPHGSSTLPRGTKTKLDGFLRAKSFGGSSKPLCLRSSSVVTQKYGLC